MGTRLSLHLPSGDLHGQESPTIFVVAKVPWRILECRLPSPPKKLLRLSWLVWTEEQVEGHRL